MPVSACLEDALPRGCGFHTLWAPGGVAWSGRLVFRWTKASCQWPQPRCGTAGVTLPVCCRGPDGSAPARAPAPLWFVFLGEDYQNGLNVGVPSQLGAFYFALSPERSLVSEPLALRGRGLQACEREPSVPAGSASGSWGLTGEVVCARIWL